MSLVRTVDVTSQMSPAEANLRWTGQGQEEEEDQDVMVESIQEAIGQQCRAPVVAIVAPTYPPDHCGVGDHTAMATAALAAAGSAVHVFTTSGVPRALPHAGVTIHAIVPRWTALRMWTLAEAIARSHPDLVLVQYVPYLYARRGIAVAAPVLAWLLRLRGIKVVTIMHEPYVPLWETARHLVVGLLQRAILVALMAASVGVATSTDFWARELRRWLPWYGQRIRRVPVGSNIPLIALGPGERLEVRRRLGIAPDDILLVFFGTLHHSKRVELILRALVSLCDRGLPARLLVIGLSPEALMPLLQRYDTPCERVVCVGYATAEEVSRYLQCGDIALAPYSDGASTRRGAIVAAMQHGLPVVSTAGRSTEFHLFDRGVVMAHHDDDQDFLTQLGALARDPSLRHVFGQRACAAYQQAFSWPQIVQQFLDIGGQRLRSLSG